MGSSLSSENSEEVPPENFSQSPFSPQREGSSSPSSPQHPPSSSLQTRCKPQAADSGSVTNLASFLPPITASSNPNPSPSAPPTSSNSSAPLPSPPSSSSLTATLPQLLSPNSPDLVNPPTGPLIMGSSAHQSLNSSDNNGQDELTPPPLQQQQQQQQQQTGQATRPSMDLSRASQFYRAGEGGPTAGRPPLNPGQSFG